MNVERGYNDNGEPEIRITRIDKDEDTGDVFEYETIITMHTDGQYWGWLDFGSTDCVGPLMPTAIKALSAVRKQHCEAEKWAEKMLADMDAGRVEFTHNEPIKQENGTIEMSGSWSVKSKN